MTFSSARDGKKEYRHTPEQMAQLKQLDRAMAELRGWRNVNDAGFDTLGDSPDPDVRRQRPIPRPSQDVGQAVRLLQWFAQKSPNVAEVAVTIPKGALPGVTITMLDGSKIHGHDRTIGVAVCRMIDTHRHLMGADQVEDSPYTR